jgi:hypothetical protein
VRVRSVALLIALALIVVVPAANARPTLTAHAAGQYLGFGEARYAIRLLLRDSNVGYEEGSLEAGCWRYRRGHNDRAKCLIDWRDTDGTLWAACAQVIETTYRYHTSVYRARVASDPRAPSHGASCG